MVKKEFRELDGEDRTTYIYLSDDNNTLVVHQSIIWLKGQGFSTVLIDTIPFLKMTVEEYTDLLNSLSNIDSVKKTYELKQKELGFYSKPLIPLFSIQFSDIIIDLVYYHEYSDGGRYFLRKIDTSDNSVIDTITLSGDSTRFVIETLIAFYDKNKDKVK